MTVPDEMVVKACEAYALADGKPWPTISAMRAALEAVAMPSDEMVEKAVEHFGRDLILKSVLDAMAPQLIAQGLREAANIVEDADTVGDQEHFRVAILKRAQELDPR